MSNKSNQALPPKEMALFRKTVRYYEQKQYKMALRCIKQILSTPQFTEHGETLAMRGLVLNCVGKHEEAREDVKRGLKSDIRSYVCWHVFGQVQRSDKKYDEAIKAYKMALKLDNDNLQILRDLSLLQIQMRDYIGYRDARYQLLVLRPGNKANWVAYANACHMLGDYDMALKIIDDYLKNKNDMKDPEHGDLVYYKVTVLQEAGRLSDAIDFLAENAAVMPDRLTYLELRADLLFKLGRIADAEEVYMRLLERNHDGVDYMKRVEECKELLNADKPSDTKRIIKEFYEKLIEKYPRNRLVKMRALLFMETDEFQRKFLEFLITGLRSGLPSLFNCLSMFYEKFEISFVEKFLVDFVRKCDQSGYEKASLDGSPHQELPSTAVWVYYFLAQHFLWHKKYETALQYVEKAVDHTPTLVDLYTLKAKIYKKFGDSGKASEFMDYAQSLDTADRYLNCKCTKYLLENCEVEAASKMCERFTREGMKSDDALYEMQCLWYPLACAKAYLARKDYGEALKRCHQIDRTLTSYYEEQYDFHTYCVRKCYMAPYVSMIHFLDNIHDNRYFVRAAKIATKIYLLLHDGPDKLDEKPKDDQPGVSEAELKKLRRKANKQKAQEEKAHDDKNNKQQASKKRLDTEVDFVESAPLDPVKLVSTKTPLDDASKLLQPAILANCKDAELYELAFEVYQRKEKVLLMLKCLNSLRKIDPKNAKLPSMVEKFKKGYESRKANFSNTVVEMIDDLMPKIGSVVSTG